MNMSTPTSAAHTTITHMAYLPTGSTCTVTETHVAAIAIVMTTTITTTKKAE
jgi:hypothetical protein